MKVVLREDVDKLGLRGEVVDVARGYARNFLLPRKLAEPATPARVKELEKVNARRALNEAQSVEQAQEIAQRLGQAELRFDVKAGETRASSSGRSRRRTSRTRSGTSSRSGSTAGRSISTSR